MRPPLRSIALVVIAGSVALAANDAAEQAERAAERFGRALIEGRAEALEPLLPDKGKVHLALDRWGPEDGMFAGGQVVAVLRDFLASGRVLSFGVTRADSDGRTSALAHASAEIIDRAGHRTRTTVRLGFQPEGGRWVLREVKESAE